MRVICLLVSCGAAGSWLAPPALLVPAPLRPSRCAPPRAKESSLERLQREALEEKQQRPVETEEQQRRERRERARQTSFATQKSEFFNVCQAQFNIALPGLKVSRAAVYMRRENPATGMLEFFPVAVWPETQGVWVVGDNQPAGIPEFAMLPGGTPAEMLLPSYPFLQSTGGEGGGPTRSYLATTLADAGLSMPIVYNGVVLGVLAVWRDASAERAVWSDGQRHVLEQVARTLAIAAVLEEHAQRQAESRGGGGGAGGGGNGGGGSAAAAAVGADGAFGGLWSSEFGESDEGLASEQADVVLREVQRMLHMSVHQLSSPLSAVRTLSKLLLRRLDSDGAGGGDDSLSREIAKDILLQSERLEELLHPVSRLASQLPVAATPAPAAATADDDGADGAENGDDGDSVPTATVPPATEPLAPPAVPPAAPSGAPLQTYAYDGDAPSWWTARAPPPVPGGRPTARAALCFPDDVLRPVASLTEGLAREAGVAFAASIDPELPGTRVPQTALREAISNLVDNALKYCEPVDGGVGARREAGLCCRWDEEEQRIRICVWNSAPPLSADELDAAFEWGERGQAARRKEGVGGSGYGLHIVQQLVALMGGEVELRNAPRPAWLREALRGGDGDNTEDDGEAPSGVSSCISLPRIV